MFLWAYVTCLTYPDPLFVICGCRGDYVCQVRNLTLMAGYGQFCSLKLSSCAVIAHLRIGCALVVTAMGFRWHLTRECLFEQCTFSVLNKTHGQHYMWRGERCENISHVSLSCNLVIVRSPSGRVIEQKTTVFMQCVHLT